MIPLKNKSLSVRLVHVIPSGEVAMQLPPRVAHAIANKFNEGDHAPPCQFCADTIPGARSIHVFRLSSLVNKLMAVRLPMR